MIRELLLDSLESLQKDKKKPINYYTETTADGNIRKHIIANSENDSLFKLLRYSSNFFSIIHLPFKFELHISGASLIEREFEFRGEGEC